MTIDYYYDSGTHMQLFRACRRRETMRDFLATVPSNAYLATGSRFAACAAAWCGLHCALTPFLVAAAPALALSEGVERAVWVGTVFLGAVVLALGSACRKAAVILTFAGGAALWAASLAGWLEPLPETVTSVAGSLILAGALWQSARVCQANACAVRPDEEQADRGV